MATDIYPYHGVAPERQPQGGLLAGLESGLERVKKQNELRKQMQMKEEFDVREGQQRQQYALELERARTAGELQKIEAQNKAKAQQKQILDEAFNIQVPNRFDEPPAKESSNVLEGVLDPFGTRKVPNILKEDKKPSGPGYRPTLPWAEAISRAKSQEELFSLYPKETAATFESDVGKRIIGIKAERNTSGLSVNSPLFGQIKANPEAVQPEDIDADPSLGPDAKTFYKGILANAKAAKMAKEARDAGELSAKEHKSLLVKQAEAQQSEYREAQKEATKAKDEYFELLSAGKPGRKAVVDGKAIELDDDAYGVRLDEYMKLLDSLRSKASEKKMEAEQKKGAWQALLGKQDVMPTVKEGTIELDHEPTPEEAMRLLKQMK